ncbi:hypothetical protein B0H14DRAFT_3160395 [Mycena olivaceomarginata]|nr:hypothetical protein B0H14DRAFT_3160395 [Mycena olivaceomarginata]
MSRSAPLEGSPRRVGADRWLDAACTLAPIAAYAADHRPASRPPLRTQRLNTQVVCTSCQRNVARGPQVSSGAGAGGGACAVQLPCTLDEAALQLLPDTIAPRVHAHAKSNWGCSSLVAPARSTVVLRDAVRKPGTKATPVAVGPARAGDEHARGHRRRYRMCCGDAAGREIEPVFVLSSVVRYHHCPCDATSLPLPGMTTAWDGAPRVVEACLAGLTWRARCWRVGQRASCFTLPGRALLVVVRARGPTKTIPEEWEPLGAACRRLEQAAKPRRSGDE